MSAVHWPKQSPYEWLAGRPSCGAPSQSAMSTTPEEVTCRSCEKHVEVDSMTADEWIAKNAYQKARNRARSKAVTELVDLHGAEFDALWEQFTLALLPDVEVEVRAAWERETAYQRKRAEERRVELEAQMEKVKSQLDALEVVE